MTRTEFLDWKTNKATQEIMSQLKERVESMTTILKDSAGLDPLQDRFYSGYIAAFNDLIHIDVEEDL